MLRSRWKAKEVFFSGTGDKTKRKSTDSLFSRLHNPGAKQNPLGTRIEDRVQKLTGKEKGKTPEKRQKALMGEETT